MTELQALHHALVVAAMLFGLGLAGFLVRRNMIVMFLCAELMLQGVSLALIAWGQLYGQWDGQMLVTFIICVAACEAAIALVLVLMLCQYSGSLDIAAWQSIREESVQPFVDQEIPEAAMTAEQQEWPILTPAGIEPKKSTDEPLHRSHV